MVAYDFAFVVAQVQDAAGATVAGPTQGVVGLYMNSLRAALTRYWADVSGGRIDVQWDADALVTVPFTQTGWTAVATLSDSQRIQAAASAAGLVPGVVPIVLSNVVGEPTAGRHVPGIGILVDAAGVCHSVVAHEMGHFFQNQGSGTGGHADVLKSFYRDEYADRTCIMGSDRSDKLGKYVFNDASLVAPLTVAATTPPALVPIRQRTGPAICVAQADRCGWLQPGGNNVAHIDPQLLGSTVLDIWAGAPPEAGLPGAARAAVLDGNAPDSGRLYATVRDAEGWDAGFWPVIAVGPRHVYLHMSLRSGDSVLLGECAATTGASINANAAPISLVVGQVSPEGVTVTFASNPWRGWGVVDGVMCAPSARIAAVTDGLTIDAFVVDALGAVRRNHFDGTGWQAGPWIELPGVTADPSAGVAAVRNDNGVTRVFVVADDGVVREWRATGSNWTGGWKLVDGANLDPGSALAAAPVAADGVMLAASLSDGMVLRTYLDANGRITNWHTAPGLPGSARAALAATSDDQVRGRTFGIATRNRDRSVWAWPEVGSTDDGTWGIVGTLLCDPRSAIAATVMVDAAEVVLVGTEPTLCLVRRGQGWVDEFPARLDRTPEGGLAMVSRAAETVDVLAIDRRGRVNVTSRALHRDYVVPQRQYEYRRTIALQAQNGNWVVAKNGGGDGMGADAPLRREWETFTMHGIGTYRGDSGTPLELVTLQAYNGQFVGAVNGGGSHAIAEAGVAGPWEQFTLTTLPGVGVTLRCINETHFLVANGGGGGALAATAVAGPSTAPGGGAVFRLNVF